MKNYIIPAMLMLSVGFVSCEDAIDLTPKDKSDYIEYFTKASATDLDNFTAPLYNNLLPKADDVAKEISDVMVNAELTEFVRAGGERYVRKSGNGWTWSNLRRINDFLTNVKYTVDTTAVPEYSAVARFFRAYFYFEKVRRYGDVPWIEEAFDSDSPGLQAPRDSRELIMTKIIEDLDYAVKHLQLREKLGVEGNFRATKGAALALKSRICLFEGTFRKYHGITLEGHDWKYYLEQCADAASKLMSGKYGEYKLYSTDNPEKDYATLFTQDAACPTEYILARSYRTAVANNQHGLTLYSELSTHGRPGFTRKFVNTYLMKTGERFTDQPGYEKMSFIDEVKGRDPRLAQTIMTPGYTFPTEDKLLSPNFTVTTTGYLTIKWAQGKGICGDDPHSTQGRCDNDIPVMRYAETLLDYAEAKAELGTVTQEDLDKSVNLVRKRAGMPPTITPNAPVDPYLASPLTGYDNVTGQYAGCILEIRRERTIELAQEARRIDDLLRWHQGKCLNQAFAGMYFDGPGEYDFKGNGKIDVVLYAKDTPRPQLANCDDDCQYLEIGRNIFLSENPAEITGGNDEKGYVNFYAGNKVVRNPWNEERDYYYPIPTNELNLNKNLKQNPGW